MGELRDPAAGRRGHVDGVAEPEVEAVAAGEPLYVVRLEPATRRVFVGPRSALEKTRFLIRDVNWLAGDAMPSRTGEVTIKWRSSQEPKAAELFRLEGGRVLVQLFEPQSAIAPGQACVVYDGSRVLGGGWISAARQEMVEEALSALGMRMEGDAVRPV